MKIPGVVKQSCGTVSIKNVSKKTCEGCAAYRLVVERNFQVFLTSSLFLCVTSAAPLDG